MIVPLEKSGLIFRKGLGLDGRPTILYSNKIAKNSTLGWARVNGICAQPNPPRSTDGSKPVGLRPGQARLNSVRVFSKKKGLNSVRSAGEAHEGVQFEPQLHKC